MLHITFQVVKSSEVNRDTMIASCLTAHMYVAHWERKGQRDPSLACVARRPMTGGGFRITDYPSGDVTIPMPS